MKIYPCRRARYCIGIAQMSTPHSVNLGTAASSDKQPSCTSSFALPLAGDTLLGFRCTCTMTNSQAAHPALRFLCHWLVTPCLGGVHARSMTPFFCFVTEYSVKITNSWLLYRNKFISVDNAHHHPLLYVNHSYSGPSVTGWLCTCEP